MSRQQQVVLEEKAGGSLMDDSRGGAFYDLSERVEKESEIKWGFRMGMPFLFTPRIVKQCTKSLNFVRSR